MVLGLEANLPHYGVALRFYDWWLHFDLARFYRLPTDLGRTYGEATVTSRTPLFNLLGSLALACLGDRFTVFQVFTAAVGWLWVLPFALLVRFLGRDAWAAGLVLIMAGAVTCVVMAVKRSTGMRVRRPEAEPRVKPAA